MTLVLPLYYFLSCRCALDTVRPPLFCRPL